MKFYSPLRYPGGKTVLAPEFKKIIEHAGLKKPIYVEPYAGGAGAALALLFDNQVSRIVINDLDYSIYCFWKSVTESPNEFIRKLYRTSVTILEWEKQKKIYLDDRTGEFERGFAAFFLNRTNRSGVMSAWPIGGVDQLGNYKIDARYNKKNLAERIRKIGEYENRIEIYNDDGIAVTKRYIKRENTFIYLDPPYFEKGAMLYMNHYGENDHQNLADVLNKNSKRNWVLTYNELIKIKNLYPNRSRRRLSFNYRVHDSSEPRKAHELMIFSDSTAI